MHEPFSRKISPIFNFSWETNTKTVSRVGWNEEGLRAKAQNPIQASITGMYS